MKRLISGDPDTLKETVICTFELEEDGKVTITYTDPKFEQLYAGMLDTVASAAGVFTVDQGKQYYDALDLVGGSFYRVEPAD